MGSEPKNLHVLVLTYPTQGHVNPMLQFCKSLASKGVTTTVAVTAFIFNTFKPHDGSIHWDTISDGFDDGGFAAATGIEHYLETFKAAGSRTLTELIQRHRDSGRPIDAIVYDALMPWALDVAKGFGLVAATFFTMPCSVNLIYYYVDKGLLRLPVAEGSYPVCLPSLPPLMPPDMPSFIYVPDSYPQYLYLLLNQMPNIQGADYILVNSVREFEPLETDEMSKIGPKLLTIGPTIPSFYIDKNNVNDKKYELDLFTIEPKEASSTRTWLKTKPKSSVIYVSFGSMAKLNTTQMAELAAGLIESNYYFIWVVRASEEEKLPKGFAPEKGLILRWSSQLEVLSSEAIGSFFTHSGWNSTLESLCLGVPMVAMPQWTDQPTTGKYVADVWKVGVRVKVGEDGIVRKEEIKACIEAVMEGDRAIEFKQNALKWKQLGLEALQQGGSSSNHIEEFIAGVMDKIAVV
ncbi:UDP-glycosyltransferase 74F2-like [Cucurbita moschata]|uniref:Mogroside I-E synthase n=1 Tax=Cucurbita moschata TaxID=3662 RepID=A0A6J1HI23_CUCMO|nr:UDP-glycosyltransferase 74F2-like [Cucurbita moschata]